MRTIELSEDEFCKLLFILGAAAGLGMERNHSWMVSAATELADVINRNNPDWIPYKAKMSIDKHIR